MKGSDLLVDGFPHGTVTGYESGCKGGICPAVMPCRTVWIRYRSDLTFRRQIDAGVALGQIIAGDVASAEADAIAEKEARRVARQSTHAPSSGWSRWDNAEDQQLRALAEQRLSAEAIADAMGRSPRTIRRRAGEAGLTLTDGRPGRTTPRISDVPALDAPEYPHGTLEGYSQGCYTVACPASPSCAEVNLVANGVVLDDVWPELPKDSRPTSKRRHREPKPRVLQPHGTNAGYARGCHAHEECPNFGTDLPTCRTAMRAYHVAYMEAKRQKAIPAEKHGTAYGYQLGCTAGAPCPVSPSCAEVVRAEEKARDRAAGIPEAEPLVDAAPVREHIRELMQGMTLEAIADQAGVHRSQLGNLIYGRSGGKGRRGGQMLQVTASRAERIMAVRS